MGNTVVITRPDGTKFSADETDVPVLEKAGYTRESEAEFRARNTEEGNREYYNITSQKIKAAIEGAGSGITLGLSDIAVRNLASEEAVKEFEGREKYQGKIRAAGEIGGALLATVASGGAAAEGTAARLAASTPMGLLTRGANAVGHAATDSRAGQLLIEGAVFGAGGHFESANVTGDPMTVEGALEDAGIGAVLNFGFGALGDRLSAAGERAKAAIAGRKAATSEFEEAAAVGRQLKDPPPSWNEFRDALEAHQSAALEKNAEAMAAADDYAHAISREGVQSYIDEFRSLRNEVQSRISETKYGKALTDAEMVATDADRAYVKSKKKFDSFIGDTEKFPKTLKGYQEAIDEVAKRYGVPKAEASTAAKPKGGFAAIAETKPTELESQLREMAASPNPLAAQPVETHPMAAEIKGYRAQLSKAAKLQAGGYAAAGGRWEKDPKALADVVASVKELHELRDQLRKYTFVKKPNLPEIPVMPEGFIKPSIAGTDAEALGLVAKEFDNTIGRAIQSARAGDGPSAIAQLRAAEARISSTPGMGDLVFPEIPGPVSAPADISPIDVPKSLREFARKRPESIEKLATTLEGSPALQESFQKFAADIGISGDVKGVHQSLSDHVKTIDRMTGEAAAAKAKREGGKAENWLDALRSWGKRGAQYTAARAADVGGWKGAITRTLAGGAVGYAMDNAEAGILTASLVGAKPGLASKLRSLMAEGAVRGGGVLKKLGPVTAYLGVSFPHGVPDPETNPRRQAVNRITDILNAKYAGPDVAYAALQPLAGAPGDLMFKMHQQVQRALQYLGATIPKDPGLDITVRGSEWTPDHSKALELAHRLEAVVDPISAIRRTLAGDGHAAGTEALWAVWPVLMANAANHFAMSAPTSGMTYEQGSAVSALFRTPMTGLQQQPVVVALQGLYLPKQQPAGGASPRSAPGGRPAAVQSPVAGSNVSQLTH